MNLFIKQIEDACEYAAAGNAAFTNAQVLNTAFLLMLKSQACKDECKTWKVRLEAERNWINFKAHFRQAYRERNDLKRLEAQGTASQLMNYTQEEITNETLEILNTLANVTIEGGTNIANLTIETANLTMENTNIKNRLKTAKDLLKGME